MTGIFETGLQVVYNYSGKNNHIRKCQEYIFVNLVMNSYYTFIFYFEFIFCMRVIFGIEIPFFWLRFYYLKIYCFGF